VGQLAHSRIMLYESGSQKSKMVDFKPEAHLSQLLEVMKSKFQLQIPCFGEQASQGRIITCSSRKRKSEVQDGGTSTRRTCISAYRHHRIEIKIINVFQSTVSQRCIVEHCRWREWEFQDSHKAEIPERSKYLANDWDSRPVSSCISPENDLLWATSLRVVRWSERTQRQEQYVWLARRRVATDITIGHRTEDAQFVADESPHPKQMTTSGWLHHSSYTVSQMTTSGWLHHSSCSAVVILSRNRFILSTKNLLKANDKLAHAAHSASFW